jgi:hypothetical protein
MNRDGIEFSLDTYSILFEEKFLKDDFYGIHSFYCDEVFGFRNFGFGFSRLVGLGF